MAAGCPCHRASQGRLPDLSRRPAPAPPASSACQRKRLAGAATGPAGFPVRRQIIRPALARAPLSTRPADCRTQISSPRRIPLSVCGRRSGNNPPGVRSISAPAVSAISRPFSGVAWPVGFDVAACRAGSIPVCRSLGRGFPDATVAVVAAMCCTTTSAQRSSHHPVPRFASPKRGCGFGITRLWRMSLRRNIGAAKLTPPGSSIRRAGTLRCCRSAGRRGSAWRGRWPRRRAG